ncbi:cation diffusion facilitator family transporter [Erythrobacter neustonensis]|uniref:Cation transporter n=1 Tax=Erythrobacter neustonensis TaxID=1112 RepID=A0A192D644_9SPHN|nr:cation diffusion facilitator family transporter [Erythrobacter neustonensis]ANK13239.1 cation transporter [Erythrobacter neustonensis]
MGASHDHGAGGHQGHSHGAGASTRRLAIALGLTTTLLIAELVGAIVFDSLALLSDAAHMVTDSAALAIALAAVKIGQRPPDDQRTFGYRRFEILAAAFNAILLFAVAGYILIEGIGRFFAPQPVGSVGMLIVATLGLLVNVIAMRILAGGKEDSLNLKGAYLEVWADMLGSLGVIGAAIAIYFTGLNWIDPVVAIAIGLWVLPRTWILLRDTTHILLQGVPRGFDLQAIRGAMGEIRGVSGVHDLHLWSVAGYDASLTAHVAIGDTEDADTVRRDVAKMLEARFAINHVTIQTEAVPCTDAAALHR